MHKQGKLNTAGELEKGKSPLFRLMSAYLFVRLNL